MGSKTKVKFYLLATAIFLCGLFLFAAVTDTGRAAGGPYVLLDNPSGGDCTLIGDWDPVGHACTLTSDLSVSTSGILFGSSGLTLHGAGHTITGSGALGSSGVDVSGLTGVHIVDMRVTGFTNGIRFSSVTDSDVTGVSATSSSNAGIYVESSQYIEIIGNAVSANAGAGVLVKDSDVMSVSGNTSSANGSSGISLSLTQQDGGSYLIADNTVSANGSDGILISTFEANSSNDTIRNNNISGNQQRGIDLNTMTGSITASTISDNTIVSNNTGGIELNGYCNWNTVSGNNVTGNQGTGIDIDTSDNNTVTANTFSGNAQEAVYLDLSSNGNTIFRNSFSDNNGVDSDPQKRQTFISSDSNNNVFSRPFPDGGNFWSDHDTPGEGCANQYYDAFCDSPLVLTFTGSSQVLSDNLPWTRAGGWHDRHYFFPWYDNAAGSNWVLMANPSSATADLDFDLAIAGEWRDLTPFKLSGDGCPAPPATCAAGQAPPGRTVTPMLPIPTGGPVDVASIDGGSAIVSERTLWPKGGSSLEEVTGTDAARVSDHFFWTWYDQQSPGFANWILVANPSPTETVHAVISFKDSSSGPVTAESDIAPGQNWNPQFPGKMGGPVELKAYRQGGSWPDDARAVIASQRVLTAYGNAFNEVPGIPESELSANYLWTWYDMQSPGASNWVLVANPYPVDNVKVDIEVGNATQTVFLAAAGTPGDIAYVTFPGEMQGPVRVLAYTEPGVDTHIPQKVIASQRSLWGGSFEEVPGFPAGMGVLDAFTGGASEYYWTWYDQQTPGMQNWLLIANPMIAGLPDAHNIYCEVWVGGQQVLRITDPAAVLVPKGITGPGGQTDMLLLQFPGKMDGPVEVRAWRDLGGSLGPDNVIASQRVLYNGYFNETVGVQLN